MINLYQWLADVDASKVMARNTWLTRNYYCQPDGDFDDPWHCRPTLSYDEAWRRASHVLATDAHFWGQRYQAHGNAAGYPDRTDIILRHSGDFRTGTPTKLSDVWLNNLGFLAKKDREVTTDVRLIHVLGRIFHCAREGGFGYVSRDSKDYNCSEATLQVPA